jgi:hypothetical protein
LFSTEGTLCLSERGFLSLLKALSAFSEELPVRFYKLHDKMLLSGSLNATLVIAELNKKDNDLIFANSAILLACLS